MRGLPAWDDSNRRIRRLAVTAEALLERGKGQSARAEPLSDVTLTWKGMLRNNRSRFRSSRASQEPRTSPLLLLDLNGRRRCLPRGQGASPRCLRVDCGLTSVQTMSPFS